MENIYINHWAVFTCAIVSFIIGALWFSPLLFYRTWQKENNLSDEDITKINHAKVYSISFILALIISYNLAFFLGDSKTDWLWGTTAGFLAGVWLGGDDICYYCII